MNGKGEAIRNIFEYHLKENNGIDVTIYKNWQTPQMSSSESKAVKADRKFEFSISTEINRNDVIQIKNGRDFYKVLDIDEDVQIGVMVKLIAQVAKIDQLGNQILLNSDNKAVFHGDVYGVQIGGQGNTQTITITNKTNNGEFDKVISEILNIIQSSSLHIDDKNEFINDVKSINNFALRNPNPELIERAKSKINYLETALKVTDIGIKLMPYYPQIYAFFDGLMK